MSEAADIVRKRLGSYDSTRHPAYKAHRALDALVAERDEARRDWKQYVHEVEDTLARAEAAEAEVARLRGALEQIVAHERHSSAPSDCLVVAIASARAALAPKADG